MIAPPRRRPVIGVTGPDRGGLAAWVFTWLAVELAGGHAVRITPRRPRRIVGLGGLIVGGGADVDPKLYGAADDPVPVPERHRGHSWLRYVLGVVLLPLIWLFRKAVGHFSTYARDPARDALELRLIRQAVDRGLPVLGICRGEQLLNVFFGGSLHQALTGFYVEDPEVRTVLPKRLVLTAAGTRLAELLGPDERVNALHRQAIDRLGAGLRVAARDRNGIVQAIEHMACPFVVGVQWHPEFLPQVDSQRAIFRALIAEAERVAVRRLDNPRPDGPPGAAARGSDANGLLRSRGSEEILRSTSG